jgi:flagellar basal-body rod modification protein FlgD
MVTAANAPLIPGGNGNAELGHKSKAVTKEVAKDRSVLTKMLDKSRDEQYNVFMKMFLAQVKNQNPDNPMSTHEMTQSVMSFFSAAEQAQTNKLLKQGNDMRIKEQMATAKSYLNKDIVYEGKVMRFEGEAEEIQLMMPADIKEAELVILDANQKLVKTIPLNITPGKQITTWDGTSDTHDDIKVAPGIYYTLVRAHDGREKNIEIPTILKGRVRQISYQEEDGEFLLLVKDDIGVEVDDLISVRKPVSEELLGLSKNMQAKISQYEKLTDILKGQFQMEASNFSNSIPEYIS